MHVRGIITLRVDKGIQLIFMAEIFSEKPVCSSQPKKEQLFPTN